VPSSRFDAAARAHPVRSPVLLRVPPWEQAPRLHSGPARVASGERVQPVQAMPWPRWPQAVHSPLLPAGWSALAAREHLAIRWACRSSDIAACSPPRSHHRQDMEYGALGSEVTPCQGTGTAGPGKLEASHLTPSQEDSRAARTGPLGAHADTPRTYSFLVDQSEQGSPLRHTERPERHGSNRARTRMPQQCCSQSGVGNK
jgi:hypothetical protein